MTSDPAPFPLSLPPVRVALRSAVSAAGVRSLLHAVGVPVVQTSEAVLIVDDSWQARADELDALLPELSGVVALGHTDWAGLFQDWAAAGWPGGWAVLSPDVEPAELLAGVLGAACGLVVLPPALTWAALALPAAALSPEAAEEDVDADGLTSADEVGLTPRELDVLVLLAEGLSNKRVARELGITESTVKFHVGALYSKLGVQSRAGAVARGIGLGLVRV